MFTVLFTSCTAGTRLCPGVRTIDLSFALFAICLGCVSVWLVMCVLALEWWPWVLRGCGRIPLCWRSLLVPGLWSCGTTKPHYEHGGFAGKCVSPSPTPEQSWCWRCRLSQYKWCLGTYMKYHEVTSDLVESPYRIQGSIFIYIYTHMWCLKVFNKNVQFEKLNYSWTYQNMNIYIYML